MAKISDNLQDILNAKSDIKSALIEKGVEPEGGLNTYAAAVRKIKGDGGGKYEMTFPNDVVAVDVKMNNIDITETTVGEGTVNIPEVSGDLFVKVSEFKSITYIIDSNCDCDNTLDRIPASHQYTATLTPHYGYEWDNVTVMMGGVNVTSTVFNQTSGVVDITEVDGDIVVSVTVKLKTYNIVNNLTRSGNSNTATKITHGQSYTATITPDPHYALTKVYVEMDDTVLYDETWDELDGKESFTISILQAIEDIHISVESKMVIVVSSNLLDVTSSNSQTKYRYGESYTTTLTTTKYYDFVDRDCSDSGASWSTVNLESDRTRTCTLTIPRLTQDVSISSSGERVRYSITNSLTETTSSNTNGTIYEGESYGATLTPTLYFEIHEHSVKMGGVDITGSAYNDGNILVAEVIGPLEIMAVSERIVVKVTNNLTGITTSNSATTALMGLPYSELLTVDYSRYDDISITVTMGGETIQYHNMENGEIVIPLVLGDIVVTANAIISTPAQYNTLDHYSFDEIMELESGESVDVILASPRVNHGYILGYDGEKLANYGNGYKNLLWMQHEIAPVSSDPKYHMSLYKRQDTKMEDKYGPVARTFSVSGTFYNSTITKLTSSISGYDLYGCSANFSNGNATRTGSVTITFNGKTLPQEIYLKAYSSRGNATNYHCYIQYNGTTVVAGTNNQTLTSISNFTQYSLNSNSITFTIEGRNNLTWTANNVNVWFLVPNDVTEIDIIGQQEVPDGLPYFTLTTKLGGKSITDPGNLRATPDGFNILEMENITSPNTTAGLLQHNNPCVFKFSRISDGLLLSSGSEIGPLGFESGESDKTVWYLYKPGTAGYSTSAVTVTNRLTNATSSNSANSVTYGASYSATLSWDESRTPYKLEVEMCGHDITLAAFNAATKEVYIPCVIGPVTIIIACVDAEDMKKVTYTLVDVAGMTDKTGYSESMSTSTYDAVLEGDKYTAKPTFNGLTTLSSRNFGITIEPSQYQYMKVTECYAEMGGQRYDNIYNPTTNTITIQEITGDCNITVKALYVVGYVDDTYYDSDLSDNHILVETDALGSGSYRARYANLGQDISDYNDITTFNI